MDKQLILEILQDWNFWEKPLESGKPRQGYTKKFMGLLKTNVTIAIIGIRRSGKSYIMRQIIEKLLENKIDNKKIEYNHELTKEATRKIFSLLNINDNLIITSNSELPISSGLGSSAGYSLAIIDALIKRYKI
ncbi:MAG: AAA family ATPase, partial [Nanoarchaeota archaeon]